MSTFSFPLPERQLATFLYGNPQTGLFPRYHFHVGDTFLEQAPFTTLEAQGKRRATRIIRLGHQDKWYYAVGCDNLEQELGITVTVRDNPYLGRGEQRGMDTARGAGKGRPVQRRLLRDRQLLF